MVIQKRGLIVLFSLLFILLFSSFSFAANYEGLQLKKDNDDSTYTTYDAATGDGYGPKGWGWYTGNYCESAGTTGSYDYDLPSFPPSSSGCYIGAVDYDPVLDDDCLYAYAKPGYIIYSHKYTKLDASGSTGFGGDGAEDAANFLNWGWLISPGGICADDHYWHTCDVAEAYKSIDITTDSTKKEKTRFYCLKTVKGNTYLWMTAEQVDATVDADDDGVPAGKPGVFDGYLDCDDNNPNRWGKFDCKPNIDSATKKLNPTKPEICTIEAAKEIIGNGIDEDCNNKDVLDADESKELCENINNIVKGESYFWMGSEVKDNGKDAGCCGDDPADFGKIYTTKSGDALCLENDKNKVGTFEGGVEATINAFMKGDKNNPLPCSVGHWCAPLMTSLPFHIFTIKQPGQSAYDVVSNGYSWEECKEGKEGPLPKPPITTEPAAVNGFYCYKEGDHWSWVNCKPQAENEQKTLVKNGIKDRVEGDGLCV